MKFCIVLLVAFAAFAAAFSGFGIRKLFRFQAANTFHKLSEIAPSTETTQVFIGNLPFTVDENELSGLVQDKFSSSIGALKIIKDRETGRSRGFGYVTYNTKAEAEAAVAALGGLEIDGRGIKVDIVVPRPDSERRERTDRAERPPRRENADFKAFVGNLDFKTRESDLMALCEQKLGAGVVTRVDLVTDRETRKFRGFGYLVVNTAEDIPKVISALSGSIVLNREIRVDEATQRKEGFERPGADASQFNRRESSPRPAGAGGEKFSIYLGNLSWDVNQEIIEGMLTDLVGADVFSNVRIATDRETGKPRGFCHVDFKDSESLEKALVELEGIEVYGRVLKVDKAQSKPKTEGGGGRPDFRSGGGGGARSGGRSNDRYSEGGSGSFNAW